MARRHAPRAEYAVWPQLRDRARQSRKEPTPAEEKLWNAVRANKLGYKFRRQHPMRSYYVDFCCPKAALVIELDGSIHETQQADDAIRQEFIEGREYRVLRFSNDAVLNRLAEVLLTIRAALASGPS
jgi:very-short-patch-repair endonuclease